MGRKVGGWGWDMVVAPLDGFCGIVYSSWVFTKANNKPYLWSREDVTRTRDGSVICFLFYIFNNHGRKI